MMPSSLCFSEELRPGAKADGMIFCKLHLLLLYVPSGAFPVIHNQKEMLPLNSVKEGLIEPRYLVTVKMISRMICLEFCDLLKSLC